ncbi:MAG: hypothetical protein HY366_01565, partial [Candidatus Aenigmarchaeota archaeon]|nr:hypothetical protein [Candidatus Aenigmarchaeota archaeon]
VERSVDKGVAKGSQKLRDDFNDFRKTMQAGLSEVSKDTTAALKELSSKFEALRTESERNNRDTRDRLEKELNAGLSALTTKIDATMAALDAALAEKRAELADRLSESIKENEGVVDDLTSKVTSLENVIAIQEGGLKSYVSAELKNAAIAMQEGIRANLENAISQAKSSLDKELEGERLAHARKAEEHGTQIEEHRKRANALEEAFSRYSEEISRLIDDSNKRVTQMTSALEARLNETLNARIAKDAVYFKEVNETLAALIRDFNAERTALRDGIGTLVEQQLNERQVFERVDSKVEYLENLIDLQNKGFDEKIAREVSRSIVDQTVQVQKKFEAVEEQLKSAEAYVELKSKESSSRSTEMAEALKKEMESVSETVRSYANALEGRYGKRLDELKKSLQAQVDDIRDSTSAAVTDVLKESHSVLTEIQRKVENVDNVLVLQEEGEENIKNELKTRMDQMKNSMDAMVNQRIESRIHATEARLDEKYGEVRRTLKDQVRDVLTQDAEALATAKVENVLFAMSEELERKKREVEQEIERIQTRAVASVDDVRRQIEDDIKRAYADVEQNAQKLREELAEVQTLRAKVNADMERTGRVDLSEVLARLVRIENELASLKRSGAVIRQPIIME